MVTKAQLVEACSRYNDQIDVFNSNLTKEKEAKEQYYKTQNEKKASWDTLMVRLHNINKLCVGAKVKLTDDLIVQISDHVYSDLGFTKHRHATITSISHDNNVVWCVLAQGERRGYIKFTELKDAIIFEKETTNGKTGS